MTQSRIFAVEDDVEDRTFLQEAFKVNGCTKELLFLELFEELQMFLNNLSLDKLPQLIILDNYINSISAVSTIDLLVHNPRLAHVKLAIYTTSLPARTCADYIAQGVHLCLQKGSTAEQINEDVTKFCKLAASSIEGEAA
ncbi:MAG TPA: hypothetical protein VGE66_04005 [Chitinophagaceae bacterium]